MNFAGMAPASGLARVTFMAREPGFAAARAGSKSPAPPLEPLENEEKQMKLSYRKKPRARRGPRTGQQRA